MRLTKRTASAIMAVMVALTLLPTAAYALPVIGGAVDAEGIMLEPEASSTTKWPSSLKSAGLKFDLKKNTPVTVNMYTRGTSGLKYNATIRNLSMSTTKSGRKKATFNITWKLTGISAKQTKAILKQFHNKQKADDVFGDFYWFLIDYNTRIPQTSLM